MKAYLVELPRYDLSWLYDNYDVGYIFKGKPPRAVRENADALYDEIFDWAEENWKSEDFLVLTGNLTVMVIAAMAIRDATEMLPKMLKFNSDKERYEEIFTDIKVR